MNDKGESDVTLRGTEEIDHFDSVAISSGFRESLKLPEVAVVEDGFERSTSITKIQGHEGILLGLKVLES